MPINDKKPTDVLFDEVKPESVYRKISPNSDLIVAKKNVDGLVGKIAKRVKHHMMEVKVISIIQSVNAVDSVPSSVQNLAGVDEDLLDLELAQIFVQERCLKGLFLNLQYFPQSTHLKIAKMLIENGYGVEVISNFELFDSLDFAIVFAEFVGYLKEGEYIKVENLVKLNSIRGIDVYCLVKIMVESGNGEYVLESIRRNDLQIGNYNHLEIVKLHIAYLYREGSIANSGVWELLQALSKVDLVEINEATAKELKK